MTPVLIGLGLPLEVWSTAVQKSGSWKSLHFINMVFLKGGEFPFLFASWRSGIWGPQPAVPTEKENEPFRSGFGNSPNLHQVTTKRKNWSQIELKHCFSRRWRFCQYSWPWHLYLHLFHQWKTSAKSLTTGQEDSSHVGLETPKNGQAKHIKVSSVVKIFNERRLTSKRTICKLMSSKGPNPPN